MLRISRERFTDAPAFTKASFVLTPLYTKLPSLYCCIRKFWVVVGFTVVIVCFALNYCLYECNFIIFIWEDSMRKVNNLFSF